MGNESSCYNEPFVLYQSKIKQDLPNSFQVSHSNSLKSLNIEKDNDSFQKVQIGDKLNKLNKIFKSGVSNNISPNKKPNKGKINSYEPKVIADPPIIPVLSEKNKKYSYIDKNENKLNEEEKLILINKESIPRRSKLDENGNNEYVRGPLLNSSTGNVYSGLSKLSGGIVAIKVITLKDANDEFLTLMKKQIKNLVEKLSELKHKNIINIKCFQETSNKRGKIYNLLPNIEVEIVTESTNGGSIKQLLNKFGTFEEKLIKLYVKQILDALAYLHEKNIIHKKIKNTNILIDENGVVKLTDFIISNLCGASDNCEDFENKFIEVSNDQSGM